MKRLGPPSFPPSKPWDSRMQEAACSDLKPVETLHENEWFAVRNRGGYFTLEYHDSHVIVLPVLDHTSIVMVRVKRPVICDSPLEFPGGSGPFSEGTIEIAARELREETGIAISDLERFQALPPISVSTTRMPRFAYVYRVDISRSEFEARGVHDDEVDEVVELTADEIVRLVENGGIYVSVPLALIARFLASRMRPSA